MGEQSNITVNISKNIDESFSLNSAAGVVFGFIYVSTVIISLAGNSLVLVVCCRGTRRGNAFTTTTTPLFNLHIANLSTADMLFTLLTVIDVADLLSGEWIMGDVLCKVQGFLLETCYSASVLTLVAISRERLKSASEIEMKSRAHKAKERKKCTTLIWISALLLCSPLLYAYTVIESEDDKTLCVNTAWKDVGRQIYYSFAAVILFLFPLAFMIRSYLRIRWVFKSQVMPNVRITDSIRTRQRKASKMLGVVTLVFACLWTPFIIVRELKYFYLYNGFVLWKLSQLLLLLNSASNPFVYSFYSSQFRTCLKSLLNCYFIRAPMNSIVKINTIPRRTSLPSANSNSLM